MLAHSSDVHTNVIFLTKRYILKTFYACMLHTLKFSFKNVLTCCLLLHAIERSKEMNFEDKKVFVGNLPLFTKEDEVVDILRGFATNLSITEIFVWKNRNTPTNVQTEAAFVTLQTNEIRDELIRNYRLKYPDRSIRLPFRNRYGNETNIYITLCYIKPDKRHKDPKPFQRTKETAKAPNFPQPKHTNNKACKQDELTQVNRQQEINLSEENEQLVAC